MTGSWRAADPAVDSTRRNRGQARVWRLVDPGDDGTVQVGPEVESLAPAGLMHAEAAGDELVAAPRRERVGSEILRLSTMPRRACSAALLVGSTPG